jgi:dihydroorotate dehydrogenase
MSKFFEQFIRPALFRLDAETAHELGLKVLELNFARGSLRRDQQARNREIFGPIDRFGLNFRDPLGVAAGFDKNGKVVNQLAALGFGFVEVGTVTFEPQPGNQKPRLFRLPDDQALINRLGFNNEGALKIAERLSKVRKNCVLGVNIGRNKNVANDDAVENYLETFRAVRDVADYVVVNVSSPNTPNLRELQATKNLEHLLNELQEENRNVGKAVRPLLVKIAPDLTEAEIEDVVDVCLRCEIDGIVATNTSISRAELRSSNVDDHGPGGLSGRPIADISNHVISSVYRASKGKLPIIGVGGIFTSQDAFEKISAGACLLQAYTGFIYSGPSFARDINSGLADILKNNGFSSVDAAVGSGLK